MTLTPTAPEPARAVPPGAPGPHTPPDAVHCTIDGFDVAVPKGTLTWMPSMVSDTVFWGWTASTSAVPGFSGAVVMVLGHLQLVGEERGPHRVEGAAALGQVLDVLLAEVLDRALDGAHRSVGQRAERPAQDVVALVEEEVEVALLALARLEPVGAAAS